MANIKKIIPIIFLIILFSFIFFYRLDYNTLESWDEAWYASIAKNIAQTGNFLQMSWRGQPYYDHPPMGFWLMAISYKLLGINEFSTRLPSALLGLLSIILIYQTGFELSKKRAVGFVASLILGTSVWYVIRVRSGNLESVFIFFYLLTVWLSLKSARNFLWFPLTMLSFAGLILSKTLVGLSAVILILFLNWRQIIQFKKNFILIFMGLWLFFLALYPWYGYQLKNYSDFYQYHFIHKGTRDKTFTSYFQLSYQQPLFYIHMGVRKWYKLWQVAIIYNLISLIVVFRQFIKNKNTGKFSTYLFLLLWNLVVIYPFLTSEKTELWHLIPSYLPISITVAYIFYDTRFLFFKFISNKEKIFETFYLIGFIFLAAIQFINFRKEVFPASKYITDQVDVAKRLTKYKQKIYLDIDYLPVAIFYSGKNVETLVYEASGEATFSRLFEIDNGKVIGVTKNWVVEDLEKKKLPFRLLEKNNTYSMITKL